MERKIFDVTMSIREKMISWPGDGPVHVQRIKSMIDGDRLNLSRLDMSAHTGTHIDAPVHFLEAGTGIDTVSLDLLMGPAVLVHLPGVKEIGAYQLKNAGIPAGTERLLLKTDNSALLDKGTFDEKFTFLTLDGARYLVDKHVRLVGIDYLSVAQYGMGDGVHQELLREEIVIIEGLDLREVVPGIYQMTALPLKIAGCDGAPARVILTT
ncbi:MAG: cyclase family protein [bacterium]|nr:cyclase family protein [bacterium]MDT8395357.1 cyclase family protein [bacterium]